MRIQVNLSEEMIRRVDKIAELYGVTRSGLLSTFIGQQVTQIEMSQNIASNLFRDKEFQEKIIKSVETE